MSEWVVRTWHSDQTTNRMELEAAVANVMHACFAAYSKIDRFALEKDVRRRLRRGEAVETPLATFRAQPNDW
jgi:hypothetical protein